MKYNINSCQPQLQYKFIFSIDLVAHSLFLSSSPRTLQLLILTNNLNHVLPILTCLLFSETKMEWI